MDDDVDDNEDGISDGIVVMKKGDGDDEVCNKARLISTLILAMVKMMVMMLKIVMVKVLMLIAMMIVMVKILMVM